MANERFIHFRALTCFGTWQDTFAGYEESERHFRNVFVGLRREQSTIYLMYVEVRRPVVL